MSSILAEILARKRNEVEAAKSERSEADVAAAAKSAAAVRPFRASLEQAIEKRGLGLIAECKKASPSKGLLRADFAPAAIAAAYAEGGAACLSVLTDGHFFQGAPEHLVLARQSCRLPVLRKDFVFDAYQIHESRALGADCILLILAMLEDGQARELERLALDWGMEVLLEVHNEEELDRALQMASRIVGINNRDLRSFRTTLDVSERLRPGIPSDRLVVSESGIVGADDIARLRSCGIHCVLVGETLMRAGDITAATRDLFAGP